MKSVITNATQIKNNNSELNSTNNTGSHAVISLYKNNC